MCLRILRRGGCRCVFLFRQSSLQVDLFWEECLACGRKSIVFQKSKRLGRPQRHGCILFGLPLQDRRGVCQRSRGLFMMGPKTVLFQSFFANKNY